MLCSIIFGHSNSLMQTLMSNKQLHNVHSKNFIQRLFLKLKRDSLMIDQITKIRSEQDLNQTGHFEN